MNLKESISSVEWEKAPTLVDFFPYCDLFSIRVHLLLKVDHFSAMDKYKDVCDDKSARSEPAMYRARHWNCPLSI